jgi:hypothetical protein
MLALSSNEKWRVEKSRFSRFVCKSTFPGVSLEVLQSHFYQHRQSKIYDHFPETDTQ